ncbi:N-acetyltransferase [Marivirga sp. S37H4]|uniref:N-acetyltransferase n=1 Tax=Marivirga aurantiaca TaxID=2802615 RepID=A0A934X0W4_9BACT|nr:GNAT family N-acetyltransferase [Marivirga aurantiaca]MBK6266300.1 N-acetyltransferase [Marivirga aurantiaca]
MNIERKEEDMNGAFVANDNGTKAGEMTYQVRNDGKIVIKETEVNPEYREQGLGKKLVTAAVEHARNKDLKILTECTYAEAMFEKMPQLRDVWDEAK